MTREEAAMCKEIARELRQQLPEQVNLADLMGAEAVMGSMWGWDDPEPYAMYRAACWLEALADSSPTPDPDTGLVPCGCGGKAKCLHHLTPDGDYAVKCGKCKIMTDWFNSPEDAIKAFNTAMGWKGGLEVDDD